MITIETPTSPLPSPQRGLYAGLGVGLLLLFLSNFIPMQVEFWTALRASFWQGVTYGAGAALGMIWGMGLLTRLSHTKNNRNHRNKAHEREALRDPQAVREVLQKGTP